MNPFAALSQELKERPGHAYTASVAKDRPRGEFRPATPRPAVDNPWNLAPAQCEVMGHLVQGAMNFEMAAEMGLSVRTIEAHVLACLTRMSTREGRRINRVSAAVLWDRFLRGGLAG